MISDLDLNEINNLSYAISVYIEQRLEKGYEREEFDSLCYYTLKALSKWTGETWVGIPKEEKVRDTFQRFFVAIVKLIEFIRRFKEVMSDDEIEFSKRASYNGIIYRYLGSNDPHNEKLVDIVYSDIYVSWSKAENNNYIESKLHGPCLWIKARTKDFGIDIEGIQAFYKLFSGKDYYVAKGEEREVIYPTKLACILETKVI